MIEMAITTHLHAPVAKTPQIDRHALANLRRCIFLFIYFSPP